jgi:aminoglycoside 6'-N-acetyltransferase
VGDETGLWELLRPVREEHLSFLEDLRRPENSAPYNWTGYHGAQDLRQRLDRDGFLGPDDGSLVVTLPDGTPVGCVSWHGVNHGKPPASRCWNIGITIAPLHCGRGLGTEAQRLLAAYLLATTTVNRIEADTDVTNLAEQRSLEKAGFTREGTMRGAQFREGAWHDMVLFSRLRHD